MSFLAPFFLLGALAVVAPVLFHMVRRTTKERQRFGSLMFLQPTPPRLTKRSRLEHWLLLLLRAAALILIALAFARPFLRSAAEEKPSDGALRRTVVLLDRSASMQRAGLWSAAGERARAAVETAGPDGEVAVLAFDRAAEPVLTFEDWRTAAPDARLALAKERIGNLTPGPGGTWTAAALSAAAEMLADAAAADSAAAGPREIVLVTDLQEGSHLDALQGTEWPEGVTLRVEVVAPEVAGNAGLQPAVDARGAAQAADEAGMRLRITNAADSSGERFALGWTADGKTFSGTATEVYLPPGQNRILTLPWPDGAPRAGTVLLQGDGAAFDNALAVVPAETRRLPVIYAGADEPEGVPGPLHFLRRALPQNAAVTASVRLLTDPPDAAALRAAPLVVVTAPLSEAAATAIRERLTAGGTALVSLTSPDMAPVAGWLAGVNAPALALRTPEREIMLGRIDFRHPLFAPFADPRFSDFTKIRFRSFVELDASAFPGGVVLAAWENAAPALLEVPVGAGRVFFLTSGWTPPDSQLALSSKFPALLGSLLDTTAATTPLRTQLVAGEPVPRAALTPSPDLPVTIRQPDGTELALPEGPLPATGVPGVYQVTWTGGSRAFAVNADPAESLTAPLPLEELEKLGAPVASAVAPPAAESSAAAAMAGAAESENRQKLWRWMLAAVLAILLAETLLAARTARAARVTGEAVP